MTERTRTEDVRRKRTSHALGNALQNLGYESASVKRKSRQHTSSELTIIAALAFSVPAHLR